MSISRSAPPRKISAKRLAALGGSLPSRTVRPSGKRPKARKKRTAAEEREKFAREFGSPERAEWVKTLPCAACGNGPSDNAHATTGGMGLKADYRHILPLCRRCHRTQHNEGWTKLEIEFGFCRTEAAEETERAWLARNGDSTT